MKKTLIALSLLGLTSTAYASKARLLALGQDKDNNYFINDSRSVFLNAAYVNEYADTVNMEWGNTGNALELDTDDAPKAMGGFFKKVGSLVYGVHLGNENDTGALLHASASDSDYATANDLTDTDNLLDIFVAGDSGSIKWGWNFLYSKSENTDGATPANNYSNDAMATRVGVIMGDIEGYANISLGNEAKRDNTPNKAKFEGSLGFHVGGAYNMGSNKFIGSYKQLDWDQTFGATPVKTEGGFTKMTAGWGHTHDAGKAKVYTQLFYESTKVEVKYVSNPVEMTHTVVPLVVGFEAMATDWLTLRGSIRTNVVKGEVKDKGIGSHFNATFQNVISTKYGTANGAGTTESKRSLANATNVSAGATLHFGKLSLDGMIGTTGPNRGTGTVANGSTTTEAGILSTDNLLSRVALNYAF